MPARRDDVDHAWLRDKAFPWLVKWLQSEETGNGHVEHSNRHVDPEEYAETYKRLKTNLAPAILEAGRRPHSMENFSISGVE